MKNLNNNSNPEYDTGSEHQYWLCFETKQAVRTARVVPNDWFQNMVSNMVWDAFCEAHVGWRMTICFDDPTDVIAYTLWTYQNMQEQCEEVTGQRMRSLFSLVLRATAREVERIVKAWWKRYMAQLRLRIMPADSNQPLMKLILAALDNRLESNHGSDSVRKKDTS